MVERLSVVSIKKRQRVQWQPVSDNPSPRSPRLIITVAIGDRCQEYFNAWTRPAMERYAERCEADFVALEDTTQPWAFLEKFRVHEFAKQYRETLFVDADVFIRPTAPNLFGSRAGVVIHDDWPLLPSTEWLQSEVRSMMISQGVRPYRFTRCLNTGVVYCRQGSAGIWKPPPLSFYPTHCAEQIWIDHQVDLYAELPSSMNCQWYWDGFGDRWPAAEFIHLANCPDRMAWFQEHANVILPGAVR